MYVCIYREYAYIEVQHRMAHFLFYWVPKWWFDVPFDALALPFVNIKVFKQQFDVYFVFIRKLNFEFWILKR